MKERVKKVRKAIVGAAAAMGSALSALGVLAPETLSPEVYAAIGGVGALVYALVYAIRNGDASDAVDVLTDAGSDLFQSPVSAMVAAVMAAFLIAGCSSGPFAQIDTQRDRLAAAEAGFQSAVSAMTQLVRDGRISVGKADLANKAIQTGNTALDRAHAALSDDSEVSMSEAIDAVVQSTITLNNLRKEAIDASGNIDGTTNSAGNLFDRFRNLPGDTEPRRPRRGFVGGAIGAYPRTA